MRRRRRGASGNTRAAGNKVRLLHDGAQVFPAMLDAIASARTEVLLEMYWFDSDRTGTRFAEALRDKARAGVSVRLIYDAVGSIDANDAMFDELRDAGVEVHEYNPIAPWRERFRFSRIGRRDHRKLLVVDARLAITGGVNLADHWAPRTEGGGGFRDDGVEVIGPAARVLRWLFYRNFPRPAPPVLEPSREAGDVSVTVLAPELSHRRRDIYDAYVNAIARAERDITITSSYFIPPRRLRSALERAATRGVRVRIIVPKHSDIKVAQLASRALYEFLLEKGVIIYEWDGGVLHAKTAAIDDAWCTVGTFNFDALSTRYNLEVNLAIESEEVTSTLRARMDQGLENLSPVSLVGFRKRGLLIRLIERLCYAFRWML
jgi:cardiolipin synthase